MKAFMKHMEKRCVCVWGGGGGVELGLGGGLGGAAGRGIKSGGGEMPMPRYPDK